MLGLYTLVYISIIDYVYKKRVEKELLSSADENLVKVTFLVRN